jgi:hypothetical protein
MQLYVVAGQWFSPGTLVSSTNKTDCHDITEILLKVALNTITLIIALSHICMLDFQIKSNMKLSLKIMVGRDWEEFFVKETMAPYLTTSRGHFRE